VSFTAIATFGGSFIFFYAIALACRMQNFALFMLIFQIKKDIKQIILDRRAVFA